MRYLDSIRYLSSHDNSYIRYFRGHTAPVTSISLNPSSDNFLSTSLDNTVRLWDLRSQHTQGQLNLTGPHLATYDSTASVIAIAVPLAQSVLLYDVRNYDKAPFAAFDVRDLEATYASQQPATNINSHNIPANWTKVEFSNDGKNMLVATNGAGHFVLDAFEGHLAAYCVRPQGATNRIAPIELGELRAQQQAAAPSSIRGKNANGANGAAEINGNGNRTTGQGDACFSPDGRYVIGGSGPGALYAWDISQGEYGGTNNKVLRPTLDLSNREMGANSVVAYNPRHNLLLTADRSVLFWVPDEE